MLVVILGFIIGAFVSLVGGGGASLYLGVLTSNLHLDPTIAVSTSLFIALPALFFGFLTQVKIHNVNFKMGNKMIVASIPGIIFGTIVAKFIPKNVYNWVVGLILISMGIIVLVKFFFPHKNDVNSKKSQYMALGFGLLSGLMVGIGGLSGGATTTAGLTILGLTAVESAGTATYVLWVMSAVGLVGHIFTSPIAWTAGIGLIIGAILGSIFTPLVIKHLDYKKVNLILMPLLGVLIIYFGINMIV